MLAKPYFVLTLLFAIIMSLSCKKTIHETNINFLGHKGSGSNNYSDNAMENTLPAVVYGNETLDGAELDIQMSLDGTVWVFHDENVNEKNCTATSNDTIPKMHDKDIEAIMLCQESKKDRLYKLQEIADWWNNNPKATYLSLEVKFSFGAQTFDVWSGRDNYFKKLAESISTVFKTFNYPGNVLIEVNSKLFCNTLRSLPNGKNFKLCYIGEEPLPQKIENAVKLGYDGISCKYTAPTVTHENIEIAHNNGLIVQLWTPYYRNELRLAFALNPDFIQTDNIWAKQALNVK